MNTPARALNSSSKLEQRRLCPGSANAESRLPDGLEDIFDNKCSAEGTLLHAHDADPNLDRSELTEAQRQVLDLNKMLRDDFLAKQIEPLGISPDSPFQEFVEQELWLCDLDGIPVDPPFPGHFDRAYYFPVEKIVFIFDSKFGRVEVPKAFMNLQLRSYAIMFAENFECEKAIVAITQPWVSEPNNFHSAIYDGKDIPAFKRELLSIIESTQKPDAKRFPSIEACRYCKAAGGPECPESAEVVSQLTEVKIKDMPVRDLELFYERCLLAENIIEKAKTRLKYIAGKNPELLEFFEMGPGQTIRDIEDSHGAFKRCMEFPGKLLDEDPTIAAEEFASVSAASRSQLEVLVARKRKIKIDQAKTRVQEILGDFIISKPKSPALQKKKAKLFS